MTGILILRQSHAVHVLTDAAVWDKDTGVVLNAANNKCHPMTGIDAAIASTGLMRYGSLMATEIQHAGTFSSFDELIERGQDVIPDMFRSLADELNDGDASGTIYFVGWSRKRKRPEAYVMDVWSEHSTGIAVAMANSPNAGTVQNGAFVPMDMGGTPLPGPDLLTAAGFVVKKPDKWTPDRDMLRLMQIMRSEKIEGRHNIGGAAILSTIDRVGFRQRVIHRWPDEVGKMIVP